MCVCMEGFLTSQEGADTKSWGEAGFFGRVLVCETEVDVEGIGEDNRLLLADPLPLIKIPHHRDEFGGVARVLSHALEDLGV